jgi:acetyl esterase/lipase
LPAEPCCLLSPAGSGRADRPATLRDLDADPARVALAGESAGGNLALNAAIAARMAGGMQPVHLVLIYPVGGTDPNTPSSRANSAIVPLSAAGMAWFFLRVARSPEDLRDSRLDIYRSAALAALPPVTLVSAGIDPLRSDGDRLAGALTAANVPVAQRTWPGVPHEFFGMSPVVPDATEAQSWVGQRRRDAFARGRPLARR